MNEMKWRVAQAIGCCDPDRCPPARQKHPERCPTCLERATDAIAEMRNPTDAMVAAVMTQDMHYGHAGPAAHWSAMIDAALKD